MRPNRVVLTAVLVIGLLLAWISPVRSDEPILATSDVELLPWGTPVYGFSTLDPSGPQKFTGKLLGVMHNAIGSGHDLFVVVFDGSFSSSNIIAGQSGSPVYVKRGGTAYKIGTVSYGNYYATNPIAYLTPISEILAAGNNPEAPPAASLGMQPVMFVGWLKELLPAQDPFLHAVADGMTSGISVSGAPTPVVAGAVLGVQLAWGDFDLTAYGTVSHVDGEKVYMFGHPFLKLGPAQYRLVSARVLAVQRGIQQSYIVAAPVADTPPLGTITQDRETAISGVLGKEPENTIPVSVSLTTSTGEKHQFSFTSIGDPALAPRIIGIGVVQAIQSWSRGMGEMTLFVSGKLDVSGIGDVEFSNSYSDSSGPFFDVRSKLESVLQNDYSRATVKRIDVTAKVFDEYRKLTIENAVLEQSTLKPGDTINLHVTLGQQLKDPKTVNIEVPLPKDLQYGVGKVVVGDADTIDTAERSGSNVVNLTTLVESLNQKRRSDAVYVYVVLPPSRMGPGESEPPHELVLGDITAEVKKTSKRLSSNVLEYQVLVNDFQVSGDQELEFKVGNPTGGAKPPGHP